MSLAIWKSFGETWLANDKVSFNGTTKEIWVNEGVTNLDIQQDVYSSWVDWLERDTNQRYVNAMRFTGLDLIPGGETGATFFLINGWKLLYDPSVVAISGILYSDDFPTAYYNTFTGLPVFPATVSAISLTSGSGGAEVDVNAIAAAVAALFAEPSMTTAGITSSVQATLPTVPDAETVSDAVWAKDKTPFTVEGTFGKMAANTELDTRDIHVAHYNKRVWDKTGNVVTLYAEDGITPLFVFDTNTDMSEITPR